jgi:drug/metabolite transporter (DMT)-like permease
MVATTRKAIDWLLVIVVNFMWATQVPVIRMIGEKMPALTVAFVPMIVSTVIFLPILLWENKKRRVSFKWRWKDVKNFILPALFGIFLMQYLYTLGSQKTLAANAGIITLTIPVLVALFASFMLKEKLSRIRIVSFILALVGVLITSLPDLSNANFQKSQFFVGNLIFLFACGCCGYYNTACKLLVEKNYTELEILVYSSLIASILAAPLLIWAEPFNISAFLSADKLIIFGIIELSTIVYGVSMLLFFSVLKRMDVTQAILGCYLLPFFISLLGIVLLNEKLTWLMLAGGILILISTLTITVFEDRLNKYFSRQIEKTRKHEDHKNYSDCSEVI